MFYFALIAPVPTGTSTFWHPPFLSKNLPPFLSSNFQDVQYPLPLRKWG